MLINKNSNQKAKHRTPQGVAAIPGIRWLGCGNMLELTSEPIGIELWPWPFVGIDLSLTSPLGSTFFGNVLWPCPRIDLWPPLGLTFLGNDLWPCLGIDFWPLHGDWPSSGMTYDPALGSTSDLSTGIDLPRERPIMVLGSGENGVRKYREQGAWGQKDQGRGQGAKESNLGQLGSKEQKIWALHQTISHDS